MLGVIVNVITVVIGSCIGLLFKKGIPEKVSSAAMRHRAEFLVPYDKGNVLSMIHNQGQVVSEDYTAEGTQVVCLLDSTVYQRVKALLEK